MKITTSLKMDLSALNKFKSEVNRTKIEVGWLTGVEHWRSSPLNPITVAGLAAHLHYYSDWRGQFMFDSSKKNQVQDIIDSNLSHSLSLDFKSTAKMVGYELAESLRINIIEVKSPANSPKWAEIKGFNDPLIFGSRVGASPNLLSEVGYQVI